MLHVILIAIVSRRKVELLENHDRLKRKKLFSWWPLNAFVRDSSCRSVHCPQYLWKTEEKFIGFERFTKYTTWWSLYQYHITSNTESLHLTRSRSTHIQPNSRHDCDLLSFFPRTVKDWNLIPSTKVIEIFVITLAIILSLSYISYYLFMCRCESVKEYVRRSRSVGSASQEPGFTRFLFLSSKLYDNNSPFVLFLFVLHQPRCYWYWLFLLVAIFGWSL